MTRQAWTLRIEGRRARLIADDPQAKVNTFSGVAMAAFSSCLSEVEQAARQRTIAVLTVESAKPGNFIAGADISELQAIRDEAEALAKARLGQQVFNRLADLPIPTVAVIGGSALGGGCELALACRYRVLIDGDKTRLGLPEVKLGIIPGWGGTQRLPRLIGLREALPLILGGGMVDPRKALRLGLADVVLPPQEVEAGLTRFLAHLPRPRHAKGWSNALVSTGFGRDLLLKMASRETRAKAGTLYPAPFAAIELLRRSAGRSLAAGLADEATTFAHLAIGPVSRNLVHVFFANEALKKIGAPKDQRPRSDDRGGIAATGVLGAGVMGGGIAWLAADAGCRVRLRDLNWDALNKAWNTARDNFTQQVKRKKLGEAEARSRLARIGLGLDLAGFAQADLVVEAVVEKLAIKHTVLAEAEAAIRPDCLLASNTSSLRIADLAVPLKHPERFLGMHFFNPVHRMPLVEVVPGPATDPAAVDRLVGICRQWGKTPIVVGDCPGFLVNRLLLPFMNEAAWLLHDGADVATVDQVLKAYGMPMGAFRLADEVGLDVGYKVAAILADGYGARMAVAPVLRLLAEDRKLLGRKGGAGFYCYRDEREVGVNRDLAGLEPAATRRAPDAAEIRDRCLLIMVNEAARCLQEHIISDPAQLDMALLYGTGFPPAHGGLLRWADRLGISRLVDRLDRFAVQIGPRFCPAPLLRDLAGRGGVFHGHA